MSDLTLWFDTNASALKKQVLQVSYCASKGKDRPVLMQVRIDPERDQTVVACDGFRLARAGFAHVVQESWPPALVNAMELRKVVNKLKGPVSVFRNAESIVFGDGPVLPLNSSNYPNYNQLIPNDYDWRCSFHADHALDAIKMVKDVAKVEQNIVRMYPTPGVVWLESYGEGTAGAKAYFTGVLDGAIPAKPRIGFNWRYMEDALTHLKGQEVQLSGTTESHPMTLRLPDDPWYVQVIMPMAVKW